MSRPSPPVVDSLALAKMVHSRYRALEATHREPSSERTTSTSRIIKLPWSFSWASYGDWFTIVTTIEAHSKKSITGIALPAGSETLHTVANDGRMKLWNCHSGKFVGEAKFGEKVGCIINEGPLVIVGLPNTVRVFNGGKQKILRGAVGLGQVYALAAYNGRIFAGTQCGEIVCWRLNDQSDPVPTSMKGHNTGVVTMTIAGNRLYSGSLGKSIKIWDLDTLQCLQTLMGHSSVVMSLLFWDRYLISASLDKTIKIWSTSESGKINLEFTHALDHGLITLSVVADSKGRPILLCSCLDNTVRMFELPSFADRGRIGSTQAIRCITPISGKDLFLTADALGFIRVWRRVNEAP